MTVTRVTARELSVLCTYIEAGGEKPAAVILGISWRTVQVHLGHCRKKLGADSTAQAFAIAVVRGYLDVHTMRLP